MLDVAAFAETGQQREAQTGEGGHSGCSLFELKTTVDQAAQFLSSLPASSGSDGGCNIIVELKLRTIAR